MEGGLESGFELTVVEQELAEEKVAFKGGGAGGGLGVGEGVIGMAAGEARRFKMKFYQAQVDLVIGRVEAGGGFQEIPTPAGVVKGAESGGEGASVVEVGGAEFGVNTGVVGVGAPDGFQGGKGVGGATEPTLEVGDVETGFEVIGLGGQVSGEQRQGLRETSALFEGEGLREIGGRLVFWKVAEDGERAKQGE